MLPRPVAAIATVTVATLLSSLSALPVVAQAPSPAALSCGAALPRGSITLTLTVDGLPREVILHVPVVAPGERVPAVIAFHGYTAHAWQLEETSGLSDRAEALGFVVAYPEASGVPTDWTFTGHTGASADDLAMTERLLDVLEASGCVDPARIVLAGHSMGGGMAGDAACRLADRVAGAVLVSATWFAPPCEPPRPVPVLVIHALDDATLPYGSGPIGGGPVGGPEVLPVEDGAAAWAARDGCRPTPTSTAVADGDVVLRWQGCAAPVTLWRTPDGGHAWADIATDRIVEMVHGTASGPTG